MDHVGPNLLLCIHLTHSAFRTVYLLCEACNPSLGDSVHRTSASPLRVYRRQIHVVRIGNMVSRRFLACSPNMNCCQVSAVPEIVANSESNVLDSKTCRAE